MNISFQVTVSKYRMLLINFSTYLTTACNWQVLQEIHHFLTHGEGFKSSLESQLKPALAMYDNLETLLSSNGIKGKKANRAMENYAWNVRIIRGQLDRLVALKKKCRMAMEQVRKIAFPDIARCHVLIFCGRRLDAS